MGGGGWSEVSVNPLSYVPCAHDNINLHIYVGSTISSTVQQYYLYASMCE